MPHPRPSLDYTKTCSLCKETKLAELFHSNPNSRDGLQGRCKACQNRLSALYVGEAPEKKRASHNAWARKNRDHVNARQREWNRNNRERSADYDLRKNYGLPFGSYDRMLAEQGGRCAICKTDAPGRTRRFHVDHCHETKVVRGLLCHNCNIGLGHLKHSEPLLLVCIDYLKSYPKVAEYALTDSIAAKKF